MLYKMNCLGLAGFFLAAALIIPSSLAAQERYPAVARLSFISGSVSYSRGDDPDQWDETIENIPLTIGDRLYTPEDGRAELQISSGNFIRLGPRSYFSTLNLSDDVKHFYLGEGVASLNIRRLGSDEVIEIDTPNVSVTLEQPGRYRLAVDENGDSRITVRRGRVSVAASGKQITVENSEVRVYGIDSPRYEIVGLPVEDGFERWATERDDRFERAFSGASQYASEDIIGVEELSQYGRWESLPEYGYAWTPANVAVGWVPFSVGHWVWQDPWGWTWISRERWGWATSHYGRWVPYRSRWYWVPVRRGTRVRYIPACVEFVRVRDRIGWFPLHPRDRFIPWWERRERGHIDRRITYMNHNHVTIVNHNVFISARPVHQHSLRDRVIVREFVSARPAPDSFPLPSRSSLRVVSDTGERRHPRPPATVLTRAAVVRTAPPAPPPTFEEKLPEIQKRQGRPIDPATSHSWASRQDRIRTSHTAIRPAAESATADFMPRAPQAAAGIVSQPLTAWRGKRLATKEDAVAAKLAEKAAPGDRTAAQQPPVKAAREEPSKATARQPGPPQPERQLRQEPQRKPSPEQLRLEQLERQQVQREEERKAQQARRQQEQLEQLRQQQPQDRKAQQQKQQELERRQREQERALERQAQQQQRQQEQQRREQLRQQQIQEQQALPQQKQQELERRQAERRAQREQQHELIRQQRQQQLQEHQTQQQQKPAPQPRRQPEPQRESERKGLPLQKPPS